MSVSIGMSLEKIRQARKSRCSVKRIETVNQPGNELTAGEKEAWNGGEPIFEQANDAEGKAVSS
jgi:hypothetical protein